MTQMQLYLFEKLLRRVARGVDCQIKDRFLLDTGDVVEAFEDETLLFVAFKSSSLTWFR